jgi:type I restriction-modification system DNA methylase subunit
MDGSVLTNASAPDRSATDFYPTPANVTKALADYIDVRGMTVWEPACGAGHMARALEDAGASVIATELNYQGYGRGAIDYLAAEDMQCDFIITNPPFRLSEEFIRRSIERKKPFAMLLKSQYWHSAKRRNLWFDHIPIAVLPLTWRPDFHFGTKGGSPTMEVIWTIWGAEPSSGAIYEPMARPT